MRDFDPTAGEFAGHDAIRIGSRHYDPGSLITAGASILGGAMASDSAGDAAEAQAAATREANALQQKQYEQTRADLAPWRNIGGGAAYLLAQKLGIPMPAASATVDRNAIRAALLPQFTSSTQPTGRGTPNYGQGEEANQIISYSQPQGTSTVDEAGLQAAIEREVAAQSAGQPQTNPNTADYGSLLKPFTGADLASEPGYAFGLKQGQQQLDRRAAAGGNYFSGAALKAAAQYGNDYAGTKYGEAFNRDASTKRQAYDFLSGQSSSGQNAATMTANAGTQMAGQVGANTTAQGNALGAASIAQGNALQGGLQNAVNGYQQNALIKAVLGGNSGFGAPAINDDGYGVGTGSAYGGGRRGM